VIHDTYTTGCQPPGCSSAHRLLAQSSINY